MNDDIGNSEKSTNILIDIDQYPSILINLINIDQDSAL